MERRKTIGSLCNKPGKKNYDALTKSGSGTDKKWPNSVYVSKTETA